MRKSDYYFYKTIYLFKMHIFPGSERFVSGKMWYRNIDELICNFIV